jgi:hypothetical protein
MASPRPRVRALLCLSALPCLIAACNLFKPSGTGDLDDADGWIAEGNKFLTQEKFSKAAQAFQKAIDCESTNQEAWDGWLESQAGIAEDSSGVTLAMIVKEGLKFSHDSTTAVWALPLSEKDRFYRYLRILDRSEDRYLSGLGLSQFPTRLERLGYSGIKTAYALLRLCDFNSDGTITAGDTATLNMCSDGNALSNMKALLDVGKLSVDSLAKDTALVGEYNTLLSSADSLLSVLRSNSALANSSLWEEVDTVLANSRGQEVAFYKAADLKDDDGDGCADEEAPDGYDNDGDGFADEDFRVGTKGSGYRTEGGIAILATEDDADTSRLVQAAAPDSARPRSPWDKAAQDTAPLRYVSGTLWAAHPGLFRRFVPYVDESAPSYAAKHWKRSVEWTGSTLASFGLADRGIPTANDSSGALSHAALVAIRQAVLGISDAATRIRAGAALVGGCWVDDSLSLAAASARRRR